MDAQVFRVADTCWKTHSLPGSKKSSPPFSMFPVLPGFESTVAIQQQIALVAFSSARFALQLGLLNAQLLCSGSLR